MFEYEIIKKIGPDIVLVDAKPDQCRVGRHPKGLPFLK